MLALSIRGEKTVNSRGEQAVFVSVDTKWGKVSASAPSGKSKGKYEAADFSSKGIDFSVSFINLLGKKLSSTKTSFKSFDDLEKVEKIVRQYDKSNNWGLIGGNALFALEAALIKAIAKSEGRELWEFLNPNAKTLPLPLGNCIGGGVHSKKEIHPDIQEFLLLPKTKNFYDAYFINLQSYRLAKKFVSEKDRTWNGELTDEKAICPSLTTEGILSTLKDVREAIKSKFKAEIAVGMDVAASSFWKRDRYLYKYPEKKRGAKEQMDYMEELIKGNSLQYVEDPFHEEDFDSFSELLERVKGKCLVVGDDLTATQPERLEEAIRSKSINAVIVKPNQNGSLLGTKKFLDIAKSNKLIPIISHRSGETSEDIIADLAVAWETPLIKSGILGKERFAKLHRLLRIEREINTHKK